MRAVVDTNVLVSGLLWHGVPHDLLTAARDGRLTLISSPALLDELTLVLDRPKFARLLGPIGVDVAGLVSGIRQLADIYDPPPLAVSVCRDPDDDAVLALAIAADTDVIVSGDDDLLSLGYHFGIDIVTPRQALARLAPSLTEN